MANRPELLLNLEDEDFDESFGFSQKILDTWNSIGGMEVSSKTMMYLKDSIIRIKTADDRSPYEMKDKIVYVLETYQVDNKIRFPITWETITTDDLEHMYAAQDGVMLPNFMVFKSKWSSSFTPTPDFVPFNEDDGTVDNGGVNISDDELELILADIGFPFLTFQDVEYSKSEITRVCIKPAMQRFFTFFPIIEEQAGSTYGAKGSRFMVEFPPNAYACVPYYTSPGQGMGSGASGNPFTFYNEMIQSGFGGFGFGGGGMGKGVRYSGKMQPGFVGMDQKSAWLDKLAINQGYLNYFRREKYKRKKIDGKLYATGFTTIGGSLNFKWLCMSTDWDDIPFELLEPVARPMAKSAVLQQFGMLRQLVKSDIAGQLDATVLTNSRKEYEEAIKPILNSPAVSSQLAISRGGG
jgi:hypothetical protein